MSDTQIRGDASSRAPRPTEGGWLNRLDRKRVAGPFLPGHNLCPQDPRRRPFMQAPMTIRVPGQSAPRSIRPRPSFWGRTNTAQSNRDLPATASSIRAMVTRRSGQCRKSWQPWKGRKSAIVFSSGMAAISATVMALVDRGAHVVASADLYGGTYNLFNQEFPTFGMSATLQSAGSRRD